MADKGKRGVAGASNARNIPFRYHGGSVQRPRYNPIARSAENAPKRDFRELSHYENAMVLGLVCASIGYPFEGSEAVLKEIKET